MISVLLSYNQYSVSDLMFSECESEFLFFLSNLLKGSGLTSAPGSQERPNSFSGTLLVQQFAAQMILACGESSSDKKSHMSYKTRLPVYGPLIAVTCL